MRAKIPFVKQNFIPCCYFPTLKILVDDNARFLQSLQRFLEEESRSQSFDHSSKALDFLNQSFKEKKQSLYKILSLKETEDDSQEDAVHVDVKEVNNLLYDKNRFDEPSVIIVDYAMPGTNGLEFSKKIRNQNLFPIKIIMLTGEADEHTAVKAFNEGLIDRFIKKSSENCLEILKEYTEELEMVFFQYLSKIILESFKAHNNYVLEEPEFIKIFNKICQENKIIEYYLLDDSGSFIMLDDKGNVIRLIVKTKKDMISLYEIASNDGDVSPEDVNNLKNFKHLVFFSNEKDKYAPANKWKFENAHLIQGKQKYYYAVIKGTEKYPLEKKEIFSYSNYLKNKKNK